MAGANINTNKIRHCVTYCSFFRRFIEQMVTLAKLTLRTGGKDLMKQFFSHAKNCGGLRWKQPTNPAVIKVWQKNVFRCLRCRRVIVTFFSLLDQKFVGSNRLIYSALGDRRKWPIVEAIETHRQQRDDDDSGNHTAVLIDGPTRKIWSIFLPVCALSISIGNHAL